MASNVAGGLIRVRWTFKKQQLMNGHFMTTSGHFLATYMFILHKTEIQTVILRCLMRLNLSWYKSNDATPKNTKNTNLCFCTISQKNWNLIFASLNLSFVKDEDIYGKKNGQKRSYNSYLRVTFISKHSLCKKF